MNFFLSIVLNTLYYKKKKKNWGNSSLLGKSLM